MCGYRTYTGPDLPPWLETAIDVITLVALLSSAILVGCFIELV